MRRVYAIHSTNSNHNEAHFQRKTNAKYTLPKIDINIIAIRLHLTCCFQQHIWIVGTKLNKQRSILLQLKSTKMNNDALPYIKWFFFFYFLLFYLASGELFLPVFFGFGENSGMQHWGVSCLRTVLATQHSKR